ncbi:glycosyltransferase family 2 protein [Thauera sp. SDU_THAU2]|uniref:glycosyltransferase family 2 protein n=1 Tax=Thauera sp. SDU_THAU2 TaxID=3136633 RepID=UPI00311D67B5
MLRCNAAEEKEKPVMILRSAARCLARLSAVKGGVNCPEPLIMPAHRSIQPVPFLSVCIVTYEPDPGVLAATFASLDKALSALQAERGCTASVCIVDNSTVSTLRLPAHRFAGRLRQIHGQGNVGFGRAHNLCLAEADGIGELHLVLNPDVELAADALVEAVDFMRQHEDCVLASPASRSGEGEAQHLCKRYPSVLDLALRGFAPTWLKRCFETRLARYEMREEKGCANDGQETPARVRWDIPIISGCFMLLRGEAFRRLGGFDPRFFLYFEDFDLSLRAARLGRIAHVPSIRIVHHGGHAARKGWKHLVMFARSGLRFFGKHGWKLW